MTSAPSLFCLLFAGHQPPDDCEHTGTMVGEGELWESTKNKPINMVIELLIFILL